jgi:hypothetical protein
MIWLYERHEETLRLETRFNNDTQSFELIQYQPDGTQLTEQFASEDEFRVRLTALSAQLAIEQWQQKGPPLLMNDGWKI